MLDSKIETFLSVCRNMNFSKAASELNLTQPAVSQQMKYLEEYYGTKLFSYVGRKLSLTEQGEYLRNTMETFMHDSFRIKEDIHSINIQKQLRIGATMSIGEYILPVKLAEFLNTHTELNLSVTVNDTASLLHALDTGTLDFIFCEGFFDKERYDYLFLKKEKVSCFCSANYKLPHIEGIHSLFQDRLLIREQGSGTREILERKLTSCGFKINSFQDQCVFSSPSIISKMLLAGCGISFLYDSVCEEYVKSDRLKTIAIPDFELSHEFNAVWKKGSIFTQQYLNYIKELH